MKNEITLREIAKIEGICVEYAQKLAREKAFPDPLRMIGPTKIFDWRAVDRYFRDREKRKRAKAA
jgi:hypothetical protein